MFCCAAMLRASGLALTRPPSPLPAARAPPPRRGAARARAGVRRAPGASAPPQRPKPADRRERPWPRASAPAAAGPERGRTGAAFGAAPVPPPHRRPVGAAAAARPPAWPPPAAPPPAWRRRPPWRSAARCPRSGSAITPMSVPIGALPPAGTRILRSTPLPRASISMLALSVSISASTSPDLDGVALVLGPLDDRALLHRRGELGEHDLGDGHEDPPATGTGPGGRRRRSLRLRQVRLLEGLGVGHGHVGGGHADDGRVEESKHSRCTRSAISAPKPA